MRMRKKNNIIIISYSAIILGFTLLLWLAYTASAVGSTLSQHIIFWFGITSLVFVAMLCMLMGIAALNSVKRMGE